MHLVKTVLIVLVGLLSACAQSTETSENNSISLSNEERKKIEDRVYHRLVSTYRRYKNGKQDRGVIVWRLRSFVFSLERQEFEQTKKDIQKLDDQNGFLALMEQAQAWRKNLENSPAKKIYQYAGEIRRQINTIPFLLRSGASRWDVLYLYKSSLAEHLLELAGNKGHIQAKIEFTQIFEYDVARIHLELENKSTPEIQARLQKKLAIINNLADQGYMPAQFDLFHRFKDGRKVNRNLAASYFWGKRALSNGAKIKKDLGAIVEQLTPPEKILIKQWHETKVVPTLRLKN
jgi:hypothetical protein